MTMTMTKSTTGLCDSYLKHLEDPEVRAALVEDLRCAAAILDGSFDETGFDALCKANVSHRTARRLRDAAASLCDHARTHGAHCRYCESILPFARYDANILARGFGDE